MNFQHIFALTRKESIQLLRDRRLLIFILGLPLIQLIMYGYAARLTVYHLPLAVVDQSQDAKSREFIQQLVNTQYFDVSLNLHSQDEVMEAIDSSQVKAGIIIPSHFATNVDQSKANVLVLLDGTDSASVQSGYSAAALVAQNYALQISAEKVTRISTNSKVGTLPITASAQFYNPELIDIWFILPGLVGLILQTVAITQAALVVARERELGTIEPILSTPIRPIELMISKLIPLLGLCLAAMAVVLGVGIFWFGVPFHGSLLLYFWMSLLFIASSLGLGLYLSTKAEDQIEATAFGLVFMLFGLLLSGFQYPVSAMPPVLQFIAGLFPVTYFIRASRSVFVKGVGLSFVWSDVLILVAYCVVIIVIASRSFKPRLD